MQYTKKVSAFVGACVLMTLFFAGIKLQSMKLPECNTQEDIAPVVKYLYQTIEIENKFLKGHTNQVRCVAYSPDGKYIVSGADDHHLIIWNAETGDPIKTLEGHNSEVTCVTWSPKGTYIISGSEDHTLIVWDSKTGDQKKNLKGHTSGVTCVAWSSDGNYIVSGSDDHTLIVWDSNSGDQVRTFKEHTDSVTGVAWSPGGKYIASVGEDEKLILWDSKTGVIKGVKEHGDLVWCVAYSPNGSHIVSGTDNGNLIVWDSKTGEPIKILKGHQGRVTCVAYSQDGNYIISGAEGRAAHLILWDGNTHEKIKVFEEDNKGVQCIAYSPHGDSMVSGILFGKSLLLWNLVDLQAINFIATQLTVAQARLLYRLYLAKINDVSMIVDPQDLDYQSYVTLPGNVQKIVQKYLPFEVISENEIQEKMDKLRSLLFYIPGYVYGTYEKTHDEKIKAVKEAMKKFDKNSVLYKACVRLLTELETEAASENV